MNTEPLFGKLVALGHRPIPLYAFLIAVAFFEGARRLIAGEPVGAGLYPVWGAGAMLYALIVWSARSRRDRR